MTVKEKALKLPQSPGVYIMMNSDKEIIYVGKAKKLYNRVNSYFRSNASHNSKTKMMISRIFDFDYIITDTEFEALVLENSLIKRHKPKYNIILKDDKGYPFIRLSVKDEYPGFSIVSKIADDGAEYFGPYGGRVQSRRAIETVSELLHLPLCNKKFPRDIGKGRPCLNSHIGKCDAICSGNVSKEEYRERIERACMILSGKTSDVLELLEEKMLMHAENLEFERAGKLRDEIRSINALSTKQKIISGMMSDTDVLALYAGESKTFFSILHFINGTLLESETKTIETPVYGELSELLEEFLLRYYSDRSTLPRQIYLQYAPSSPDVLSEWLSELSGRRVRVICPQRGDKLKFVQMAYKNAEEKSVASTNKEEKNARILEDIKKILSLPDFPKRIEAYDISNFAGKEMVGGMVVFLNGAPARREYKRFKIKTLEGQDDPRAMQEMLKRRFFRYKNGDKAFLNCPDLILLDGGIGQVRAVLSFLREAEINAPLFGIVKDDKHMTRAIIDSQGREIGISGNQAVFRFFATLQDEVHRYSIEYHRKLRARSVTQSELTKIDGVGKKRAIKLLEHFKSIDKVKNASIPELAAVLPEKTAVSVYKYFRGGEE